MEQEKQQAKAQTPSHFAPNANSCTSSLKKNHHTGLGLSLSYSVWLEK